LSEITDIIINYWKSFCQTLPVNKKDSCPSYKIDAWAFGDSSKMADDLLKYVLSGEKTATTGLLAEYNHEQIPVTEVGQRSVILDGEKQPRCIIETTNVEVKAYNEVDERFALAEGEGFKSLKDWQEAHWTFFSRRCSILGIEPSETMTVICEEFKVIFT